MSAGAFISGPKKSEYAHEDGSGGWTAGSEVQSDDGLFALGGEGGSIGSEKASVTLYKKNGAGGYTPGSGTVKMPVITPFVRQASYAVGEEEQTYWFVNGNMYFDGDAENSLFGTGYGGVIMGDTYLYHVLDDSSVTGTQIAVNGAADFYYTYNVERTEDENGEPRYTYTLDEADGERVFAVTVYGYHRVKASADAAASYATVKMLAGNMYVRGGSYTTNFGKATAYGVYASGGYMSVEAGSFEAIEGGVCIECAYTANSDEEYLRVADGSFRSDNGDTIRVSGGRMVVTGGAFTKTAASAGVESAAIRITGKDSSVTGGASSLTFTLEGSSVYGVYAKGGSVSLAGAAFTLSGNSNYGVYADGGDVTLTGAELSFGAGSGNYGVYAKGGSVTLTDCTIAVGSDTTASGAQTGNFGVYSEGKVSLNGTCTITVQGTYSSCVYASGADASITYTAASSADSLTVTMQMQAAASDYVLSSTAISAVGGSVSLTGNVTVASDGLGVTTSSSTTGTVGTGGGSFTYAPTAEAAGSGDTPAEQLSITTTRGTAMYINGDATLSGTVNITSAIAGEGYTVAGGAEILTACACRAARSTQAARCSTSRIRAWRMTTNMCTIPQ